MPQLRYLIATLLLAVSRSPISYAQQIAPSSVRSTVLDPNGDPVPHADVRVREEGVAAPPLLSTSDSLGGFALLLLPGKRYRLAVQAPGFAPYAAALIGGASLPPVRLTLAGVTEEVNVAGETSPAKLDPGDTQTGSVLGQQQLSAMPVNGRSVTDLLAITPGVVPVTSAQPNAVVMSGVASTPPSGDLNAGALSVSGQRETANAFRVNEADVQEDVNMGLAIVPTLDSISELKVLTGSFDARLGNGSGGQVLMTTRSGTNQLHGSVYDYFRNTALDARSYFSFVRAPFHQNQFGGTLGGPALSKTTFLFADFQGTRRTQGIDTGLIPVPSLAERAGDLSAALPLLTGSVNGAAWAQQLSARFGRPVAQGEPYAKVFADGQIPVAAWSKPARQLLQYIPSPNAGDSTFSTSSRQQATHDDKGALRADGNSHLGTWTLYGFLDSYTLTDPYPTGQGGATVPGFAARNAGLAQLYSLNLTTSVGGTTLNQAHLSYMRNAANVGQPVDGIGVPLSSQGFVTGPGTLGIVPGLPATEGVENIIFNSFTLGTTVTGLAQAENLWEITDNITRSVRTHTFSAGVSFHADQINTHPDVYDNGSFSFTGSETGLDFADFLLGIDSSYTQGDGQNFYNRNHYIGLYAQDSWKATSALTLNYGLRWDVLPPWSEKGNQLLSLDPNEQSVVFPNAPQGILFPGDPGVPRTLSPTRYNSLAPRLALAWSPHGRAFGGAGNTVVRGGYGVYYSAFEGLSAGIISGNPPYGFTDTSAAPTLFDQPFVTAATGVSVGQRFPLQRVPFGASANDPVTGVDWSQFEPLTGIPAFAKDNTVPYAENYSLTIDRQLGTNTSVNLSYVGTQAHHLLVIQEVNPGDPTRCLALSTPAAVAPGSATCGPFNESETFTTAAGQLVAGTRTAFNAAFGSVNLQKTIANSHDNALEMSLRHMSRTAFLQLAYTWSRSIDQSSSLAEAVYPGDAGRSRALSSFDLSQNAIALYAYTLPFGRILPHLPRLAQGWEISGLTRIGSGFPVTLLNNNDTSLLGAAPNGINNNGIDEPAFRPGDLHLQHRPGLPAFDTTLFSLPALGTLGNARRRFFSGPGEDNTDLTLSKSTALHDGAKLNLRLEAFNVFNHSQFFGPATVNGNISGANFGSIQNASPPRLVQVAAHLSF